MSKLLSEKTRSDAQRQVEAAVARWEKAVVAFDPARFVVRHGAETKQMREEFQNMETRVQKEIHRGARKTDGFII